jgi:hypothetical protein
VEGPSVWNDDEDVVLGKARRLYHETVVEQAGHLSGAGQQNIVLKQCVSPLSHLLAK